MKITIEHEMTAENICDMFITAFEGGANSWINSVDQTGGEKPDDKNLVWWGSPNIYKLGLKMTLIDEDYKTHTINWLSIKKGIELMAKESPRHFNDMMQENGDAITGDVFLQYIVFKEIIFG